MKSVKNLPEKKTSGFSRRRTVEADLGRPLLEVFSAFDEAPLASASVAQVHGAARKPRKTCDRKTWRFLCLFFLKIFRKFWDSEMKQTWFTWNIEHPSIVRGLLNMLMRIAILEVLKTGERVAVKAGVGASSAHGIEVNLRISKILRFSLIFLKCVFGRHKNHCFLFCSSELTFLQMRLAVWQVQKPGVDRVLKASRFQI